MRKKAPFLIAFIAIFNIASAQCKLDKSQWTEVFVENFDEISSIDELEERWQFMPDNNPCTGWGYQDNDGIPGVDKDALGYAIHGECYRKDQVELRPGGILRLNARCVGGDEDVWIGCEDHDGNLKKFKFVSGMIETKTGWDDPSDTYPGTISNSTNQIWDRGFRYGMFEIRCRLPAKRSFPAFWLYSGPNEIDIFEAGEQDLISNNVHDYIAGTALNGPFAFNGSLSCGSIYEKISWDDVTTEFHTYTCMWNEDRVTIFYDGRELRTVDENLIVQGLPLIWHWFNQRIIINLGMWPWNNQDTYMDIDYVKVYKPINHDYTTPYKSEEEYMYNDLGWSTYGLPIKDQHGAIAPNTNNPDEVFLWYDAANAIYSAKKNSNGNWQTPTQITTGNLYQRHCKGDMVFNKVNNQLVYKGQDNRLQQYYLSGTSWTHGWIDDNWNSAADNVSTTQNSIAALANGNIAYKGVDNKIQIFTYSSTAQDWVKVPINHTYGPMDYVKGDVVAEEGNNGTIFYKGVDGRLQQFYKDQNGNYVHGWIDGFWNTALYTVSNRVGSIVSTANDGILYVGQFGKLWNFNWTINNGWQPTLIPHTYNSNVGYPGADYIKGNLVWNENLKKLHYVGFDGTIQSFYKIGNNWHHGWVNDYWNTSEYSTYNSTEMSKNSSLALGANGEIFYSTHHQRPSYFLWETCENLNPPCNATNLLNKNTPYQSESNSSVMKEVIVYPNPASDKLRLANVTLPSTVTIHDLLGTKVFTERIETETIDVSSLKSGNYFITITDRSQTVTKKIVIAK